MRLRAIHPADRRTLTAFDRELPGKQVGGYRHWATHRAATTDSGDDFHFAIEALNGRTVVGSMWIQAEPTTLRFSYGIGIGGQYRRCGYAEDAVTVLLVHMFTHRRYHKCEVSIHGRNLASLRLHAGLGFREEGRPRDTELRAGEVRYPVLMGLSAERFAEQGLALDTQPWRGSRHSREPRRGRHRG
ncbi:GNAT family N-acetyltransferase [Amycolatopsis acidicola]|uniref:GNAT family N-acetyltransferase n=1 Tax=Amycolatopsis acidicola TaxID=2596893 RepID=A0A5N0UIP8_9PSEU|nr:GNAT family N-acetyltransferase [Amycolatopsis acidicola]KAA9148133.1 GNAT family N-acetyltransferase [Amycolatopsis acidicola]